LAEAERSVYLVAFLWDEAACHAKRRLIEVDSSFVDLTGLYPHKVAAFFVLWGESKTGR